MRANTGEKQIFLRHGMEHARTISEGVCGCTQLPPEAHFPEAQAKPKIQISTNGKAGHGTGLRRRPNLTATQSGTTPALQRMSGEPLHLVNPVVS
jgi:hypothetical protein